MEYNRVVCIVVIPFFLLSITKQQYRIIYKGLRLFVGLHSVNQLD